MNFFPIFVLNLAFSILVDRGGGNSDVHQINKIVNISMCTIFMMQLSDNMANIARSFTIPNHRQFKT